MASKSISGSCGIVTGASSGIGRAIALELAAQGATVFAVARRADRLAALKDSAQGARGQIHTLCGDVALPEFRRQVIVQATEERGYLDFLVNSAGISSVARFAESSPERLREIMEVNFFAAAELIRLALPPLGKSTQPLIVNIGSILAHRGIPFHAEYCASKFALQGLSESLRPELKKQEIDLLVVDPGTTESELYKNDQGRGKLPWRQPQPVTAEYVARQTVLAMKQRKKQIVPNRAGRFLLAANRWFPRLLDRWLGRYG